GIFLFSIFISISSISASDEIVIGDLNNKDIVNNDFGVNSILSGNNFTSLQKAIDEASENEEIVLSNNISYKSGENTIVINKTGITINGNGHTINGQNLVRIFNITANDITLKNITLINAYSNQGGAIYNTGNNVKLIDSYLINNAVNNDSNAQGGAIYNTGSYFSINNTYFTNNSATASGTYAQGGVIYNEGSYFSINNSYFTNNSVGAISSAYGGVIYNQAYYFSIYSSVFINNAAKGNSNRGGVIYNNVGSLTASYSIFYNNTAASGKEVYKPSGTMNVSNNFWGSNNPNFSSLLVGTITRTNYIILKVNIDSPNHSLNIGDNLDYHLEMAFNNGNIFNINLLPSLQSSLNMSDGFFKEFIAQDYANMPLNTTLTGDVLAISIYWNEILLNTAYYHDTFDTFTWLNETINENGQNDFVLDLEGKTVTYHTILDLPLIDGVVVNKNLTIKNGIIDGLHTGRIFNVIGSNNFILENMTLKNGFSTLYGGAIYSPSSNLIIINSTIINNSLSSDSNMRGGAIYNNNGTLEISNSIISNNSIKMYAFNKTTNSYCYGGAIYYNGENFILNNSKIINNFIYINNELSLNNIYTYGGAIYNSGRNFTINNSTVFNNSIKFNISNINRYYVYGGAIYNEGDNFKLYDSKISENFISINDFNTTHTSPTVYGGAIYNTGDYFIINNTNINYNNIKGVNAANYHGGAIYNNGHNAIILENNIVSNNFINSSAGSKLGGFLYNSAIASILIGSFNIFTNNSATNGGVIYNYGTLSIDTSNYFYNNSATLGGAIYNYGTLSIDTSNYFYNNSATNGGVIYNGGGSSLYIYGSNTFTNNYASSGGVIFNQGLSSIDDMNYFYYNRASSGGVFYNNGIAANIIINGTNQFAYNTANSGGVTYHTGRYFTVNGNNNFSHNSVSGSGGVFYTHKGWGETPLGTNLLINGSNIFINNSAVTSGSLIFNGCLNLTINGSNIIENNSLFSVGSAYKYGGVIFNEGMYFTISGNNTFINNYFYNQAAQWNPHYLTGGVIYNTADYFTIEGYNQFINNSICAKTDTYFKTYYIYGEVIYNTGNNFVINGTNKFSDNKAYYTKYIAGGIFIEYGGVIFNTGLNFEIHGNNSFTNHSAHFGIFYNTGSILIDGSNTIKNNSVNFTGVFYNLGSSFNINGSNFITNNTAKQGSFIYNVGDGFTINYNNTIINNYAHGVGAEDGFFFYNTGSNSGMTGNNTITYNFGDNFAFIYNGGDYFIISGNNNLSNNYMGVLPSYLIYNLGSNFLINGSNTIRDYDLLIIYNEAPNFTINGSNNFINNTLGLIYNKETANNLTISGNNSFINLTIPTGSVIENFAENFTINGSNLFENISSTDSAGVIYNEGNNFKINGSNIFRNNYAPSSGGVIINHNVANFEISGSNIFEYNKAGNNGGVLNSNGGNILISGSNEFRYNSVQNYGGVFYLLDNSITPLKVTINGNNIFLANNASYGGAIYLVAGDGLTINGSNIFDSNYAIRQGGAIDISNCEILIEGNNSLINNIASLYGAAIFIEYSNRFIINGSNNISGNKAIASSKSEGIIYFIDSSSILINGHNTFSNNIVASEGIIKIIDSENFTINGSNLFEGNIAYEGGVIYTYRTTDFLINGSNSFIANHAENFGGVIYNGADNFKITGGNYFINNSAGRSGGVIANFIEMVVINGNNTFINNTAERHGGVIYNNDGDNLTISGENTFYNNSAGKDGGVIYNDYSNHFLIIGDNIFENNTSLDGRGGVISNVDSHNFTIDGNNIFNNNSASRYGGVIYNYGGVYFTINNNNSFTFNFADYGGAIQNEYGHHLLINGTNYIAYNSANTGGSLYNDDGNNVTILGSNIIEYNFADEYAGAIYNLNGAYLIISGENILRYNEAGIEGGMMYTTGSEFTITGSNDISFNHADGSAGAIFIDNANNVLIIGDNTFNNNTAGESAGAIYNWGGLNFTISGHNVFNYNMAEVEGGMMYTTGNNLTIIGFNDISFNEAGGSAGAIFNDNGNYVLIYGNNTFNYNIAGESAGAIYSWGGVNFTISGNNTFNHNAAGDYAGAIYNQGGINFTIIGKNTLNYNIAVVEGGMMYTTGNGLTIIGFNDISFNHADGSAGAIFNDNAHNVLVDGSNTFNNNTALGYGGVIYNWGGLNFIISGGNVFNNNSANEAGVIYADVGGELYIIGMNIFEDNSAIKNGGSIYNLGDLDINGNKFINNDAITGKAIYNEKDAYLSLNNSNFTGESIFVDNAGTLYLFNNTMLSDGIEKILNTGLITSTVNITILNNDTVIVDYMDSVNLTGVITDDMGNVIVDNALIFKIGNVTNVTTNNYNDGVFFANYIINNIGTFIVSADYLGAIDLIINTGILTVDIQNSTLNIEIENIVYGDNLVVNIYLTDIKGRNISGLVYLSIDNYEAKNYSVVNGFLTLNLAGFNAGNYNFNGSFEGNTYYFASKTNGSFIVYKELAIVNISASDIIFGENFIANITLKDSKDNNINGQLQIVFSNGVTQTVNVINGLYVLTNSSMLAGNYNITAIFVNNTNYYGSYDFVNFTVYKADTELIIDVGVSEYRDVAINLYTDSKATGNITVTVDGIDYNVTINEGRGVLTIPRLNAGNYTIYAKYLGDNNFNPNVATLNFTVLKSNPFLNLEAHVVTASDVIVFVSSESDATGYVIIKINGYERNVTLIGGKGSAIFNNLPVGTYTVNGTYNGDDNYNNVSNQTQFTLEKRDSILELNVENITYGDYLTVIVTLKDVLGGSLSGIVNLTFSNGYSELISVVNGLYVWTGSGGTAGNFNVKATFAGDEYNFASNASVNFTVFKLDTDLQINHIISNQNEVAITVTTSSKATGNVTISINGKTENVTLVNGIASLYVPSLNAGNYTIFAYYPGDINFNNVSNSQNFTINKTDTVLNIETIIRDNGNVTIIVSVNNGATGNVTIDVGGYKRNITLIDGVATTTYLNLIAGYYTVNVTYNGDLNSKSAFNSTNFTILKLATVLNITVENIVYGDIVHVIISLKDSNGVGLNGLVNVTLNNGIIRILQVIDGITVLDNYDGNGINVINGTANFDIYDLNAGYYILNVSYKGNNYYEDANCTVNFTVFKANTDLTITTFIKDRDAIITFYTNSESTGTLNVTINGENRSVNLINGVGVLYLSNLDADDYQIDVVYSGDNNFNSSRNSTTFTIQKSDTFLFMEVLKTGNIVISVITDSKATGIVTIDINGNKKNITLNMGTGSAIYEDLGEGTYTAHAHYIGDKNYNEAFNSTNFNVTRLSTTLNITIMNITYDDILLIGISLKNIYGTGIDGLVNITFSNGYSELVNVVGGEASILGPNLDAGNYTITATYDGNYYFDSSKDSANFTVLMKNSTLIINVEVNEDRDAVITFYTNPKATGFLNVTIGGRNYTVQLSGSVNVLIVEKLDANNYTVYAKYYGNNNFNPTTNSSNFTVNKSNTNLNIVLNIQEGNVIVIVTTHHAATGNVTIDINGSEETIVLVNGRGQTTFYNLNPGNYILNANYTGDKNYNSILNSTTFEIAKLNTNLTIKVSDIIYGDILNIIITLKDSNGEGLNGLVNITFSNGISIIKEVVEGILVINDIKLNASDYNVSVSYNGTEYYYGSNNSTNFTVYKSQTFLNVTVSGIIYGETLNVYINFTDEEGRPISGWVFISFSDGDSRLAYVVNGTYVWTGDEGIPGNLTVNVTYDGDNNYYASKTSVNFTVYKANTDLIIDVIVTDNREAIINFYLNTKSTGSLNVIVDGISYVVNLLNGKGTLSLLHLDAKEYTIEAFYLGDIKFNSSSNSSKFTILKSNTTLNLNAVVSGNDVVIFASLTNDASGIVTININGDERNITLNNGIGSITYNGLSNGNYIVKGVYNGDKNYNSVSNNTDFVIDNKDIVLSVEDIIMYHKNGTRLYAYVTDLLGNPIEGLNISFTINGNTYYRITDLNGSCSIAINLLPGIYKASISFLGNEDYDPITVSVLVEVLSNIEGHDLIKYYKNESKYAVKVLDHQGNPSAGENVEFNINGVIYTKQTDSHGYAYLSINLYPNKYIITATHPSTGLKISNNIEVLKTIISNDVVIDSNNRVPFTVKILDNQGNPYEGQKITINIHGIIYEKLTNSEGLAYLNINLDPGSYIATVYWNGFSTSNVVTVNA
ncbi:Ig-like domain repeat protein, partial [Methanobrevibacter sp. OttesenSCG-928-I08]|nr:Ig-like domain repeat protein [Methanobrevibacter sp. OttesenSCG-928-I08]